MGGRVEGPKRSESVGGKKEGKEKKENAKQCRIENLRLSAN